MDKIKVGIVGIGNIGYYHAKNINDGKIKGMKLVAVCDIDNKKLKKAKDELNVLTFDNHIDMLKDSDIDAVIVATPHYFHCEVAVDAFKCNKHVLTEKPAGVYTRQVNEMIDEAKRSGKVFAIMFNQRTNPLYKKAKEIVSNGDLGQLKRLTWIITNWYRTQSYYDSGGWRATWKGEGGGVLINQAPHNLDLMQWIFGMPKRINGFCTVGKYHNIEVEDDATIYAEYENGANAIFITSTGEAPGTNRLEICGDRGKIVIEDGKLKWWKLHDDERKFCFEAKEDFCNPPFDYNEIVQDEQETAHCGILQNFANSILFDEPLISPGEQGLNELTISNATYLSSWKGEAVSLPFDEAEFETLLKQQFTDKNNKTNSDNKKGNVNYSQRWKVRW